MGVSGLTQYLAGQAAFKTITLQHVDATSGTPPALKLVVDGLSLAHFLRKQCKVCFMTAHFLIKGQHCLVTLVENSAPHSDLLLKRFPCVYYLEVFRKECYAFLDWLQAYGVQLLHVVFDGVFDKSKQETRFGRRSTRSKTLQYTRDLISKLDSAPFPAIESALLELNALNDVTSMTPFREVLIACLRSRNIEVTVSSSEADSAVAAICRQVEGGAVLADDSDFFILGVPLVLVASLNYVSPTKRPLCTTSSASPSEQTSPSPHVGQELVCNLYSPESVLSCLQIPSSSLPYLSFLSGNDYSGDLPIKFARGAGFAGKCSNSSQRVGCVLSWLRKSDNISAGLGRIFRKQKAMGEYDTAYKATLAQLRSSHIESPFPPPLVNLPSCHHIWELHKSAQIPSFVLGLATSKQYWTPVVLASSDFHDALLPIRSSFYRGLFRSIPETSRKPYSHKKKSPLTSNATSPVPLSYPTEVTVSEVDEILNTDYQVHLAESEPGFPLNLDPTLHKACSLEDFFIYFGLDASHVPAFKDISSTFGSEMTKVLFTLMVMRVQKIGVSDLLFEALVKHLLVLNAANWYEEVSRLPLPMPTMDMIELSSAVVVAAGWVTVVNKLCGEPLGALASGSCFFDGNVFALVARGNPSVLALSDVTGADFIIDFWRSLSLA